ncbi:MAG: quinol:cytochrome C oxidoreductase [Bacteroidia bacterium]|nr:quinol:cytochrome C oxidoreductase [Bacteroidia bacterium]
MAHGHKIELKQEFFSGNKKATKFSIILIVVGLLLTIAGVVTLPKNGASHEGTATETHHDHHDATATTPHLNYYGDHQVNHPLPPPTPEDAGAHKPWYSRIYANILTNSYFFVLVSGLALFFLALQYIANAGWTTVFKRVIEAVTTFLPIAAIIMIVILLVGKTDLYHWAHYEHEGLKPGDVGYDKVLSGKSWFLNSSFFIGGIVLIPLVWILINRKLSSLSLKEDAEGGLFAFKKSIRWSAAFSVFFAFSVSVLSWLVVMSIDAHWYSTIFSVYNFATGFVAALCAITLLVLYLKSIGHLELVTDEHIHDLGKFIFAFSIFWGYIWIAQFLLIWYAHIPEEVYYYQVRLMDQWKPYFYINTVINFVVPFFFLMTRDAKRNPKLLGFVALLLLFGHWIDVYLMVMPGSIGSLAKFGLLEIGMLLLFSGLFIYLVLIALTKRALVPINHPYLEESAHHNVGV